MRPLAAHPPNRSYLLFVLVFHLLFCPVASPLFAGGLWRAAGARQAGMDHCSVALTGFWSVENNLAGMTTVNRLTAGMGFQNRYLSPHLGTSDLAIVYPATFGNIGINVRYFGYSLFHEMKIGISYARKFGPNVSMGVQMDYLQTGLGDIYGHHDNFTFAIGLQAHVSGECVLGIYVYNPVPVKLADYADEKIPAIFRFGLSWHFSRNLLATAEAEKNTAFQPVVLRGGIEYIFKKQFFFRAGIGTSGDVFAFGFGWHFKKLNINLASTMHQTLGFSPQGSIIFHF